MPVLYGDRMAIVKNKGESRALYRFSYINMIAHILWIITYIICFAMRYSAFSSTIDQMTLMGYNEFTVSVTSPFFGILRFFSVVMLIIIIVWSLMFFHASRKGKKLCSNKFLVTVFSVDFIFAFICTLDVAVYRMIFT